jgi:16S rRNA (cytidine1402-2'-O)-methyltransferase
MNLQPGLYIVATPIGNLKDITIRALETLRASNSIFCEDSRITKILLEKYDIKPKLFVYNDHSTISERQKALKMIQQGQVISLVSDAGTPLISDPGYKLVQYLQQNQCLIEVVPGASCIIAALCLSGLPSDKFIFIGFAPRSQQERLNFFTQIQNLPATTIFFENPTRLPGTLQVAHKVLGNRNAAIVREISKIHQEVLRGKINELLDILTNRQLKGEIVLLIEKGERDFTESEILKKLEILTKEGIPKSQAAKIVANMFDLNKNLIYRISKNILA